jgi:biopolymer transport protein ExbB/TolQ
MDTLYRTTTQLFYQISNAFFWPVAIALLALFAVALADLGALLVQAWRRRRHAESDLEAIALVLLGGLDRGGVDVLAGLQMSSSLRRFWQRVHSHLTNARATSHLDLWMEEALQTEEIRVTSQLDLSRALIRIGPMLGLAGTIIPLGPALQSLLGGNMAEMVGHLVIGFGAVVVGLVMSGIAYLSTLVRERWSRVQLKEMENLCELVIRGLKARENDVEYARL